MKTLTTPYSTTLKIIAGTIASIAISFNSNAQLVNPSFELNDGTVPDDWTLDPDGAHVDTSFSYSGNNSLVVYNWYWYAKGYAGNGSFSVFDWESSGTPITQKPVSISGYYMYDTTNTVSIGDSAIVQVTAKLGTGSQSDTVSYGEIRLPAAQPENGWQPFTVQLDDWQPGVTPDYLSIFFISSSDGFCDSSANCLFFYVDDLTISSTVGTEEMESNNLLIYPNPATDHISINGLPEGASSGLIRDLSGKLIKAFSISSDRVDLNVSELPGGMYIVECAGANGFRQHNRLIIE